LKPPELPVPELSRPELPSVKGEPPPAWKKPVLLRMPEFNDRGRVVGPERGQSINAAPVALAEANVRIVGCLVVMRVEHRSLVDQLVVGHRESAGIGDPFDRDDDDRTDAGMLIAEMR